MSETIVAISTPHGVGGIAVVRLSGTSALPLAMHFMGGKSLSSHRATYGVFADGGRVVDEVVATYFQAPHSYTGEDVVEFSCHGSLFVQQEIVRLLVGCKEFPCRLAEPGEFTQRAFLNGKLDLSQAEAVADLIDSQSESAHRLAVNQLRGGYSQMLKDLRGRFVELTALLELELDFSEEEVEFADRTALNILIDTLSSEVSRLVASFKMGNAIKNGVPVAIVGKPNVGKSTLLNALLGEERAIVSPIAGTTRDTVEDTFVIEGIQFRFIDTAGIRKSDDLVESAGIERSYKAMRDAQIVICMTDNDEPLALPEEMTEKKVVWVRNKIDEVACSAPGMIPVSAKEGTNLDALRKALVDSVGYESDKTMLTNLRHHEAMTHILEALGHVKEGLSSGLPADLVVVDIREALYYLGQITGEVSSDEVLGTIFSRFCIGK
ncbi:MAG: tRNA uridine-5-carboxymethylaminomethyl(34) synthesis GTPase MnmE [Bacteroidales bacterium]|nr:tRNA uridine-5-carboxymethylaminomethyl(34) synthesis GTPase MnmE [Bacteroidales bacterium]